MTLTAVSLFPCAIVQSLLHFPPLLAVPSPIPPAEITSSEPFRAAGTPLSQSPLL